MELTVEDDDEGFGGGFKGDDEDIACSAGDMAGEGLVPDEGASTSGANDAKHERSMLATVHEVELEAVTAPEFEPVIVKLTILLDAWR